jgi:CubicO group peptidase (beta-lactamase class C family)
VTAGLDRAVVDQLAERIERDVDEGLLPAAQFALALEGEIVEERAFGEAGPDTRFCLFSATKPFVAATVWRLIGAGELDPVLPVTTWFPAFGANGKEAITLQQVMLHTAGFPSAPMGPAHWSDRAARQARMAAWRLNWEPGTRYEYHPTAAHWVLAELIEAVTGSDFRKAVHTALRLVGEHATADELMAAFGVPELPATEVTDEAVSRFNEPEVRAVGVPGGGGFARAVDVARFYQALLHGREDVWPAELLQDVTTNVRNRMADPAGTPANRTLGLLVAGDDGFAHVRGFGRTVSPGTFGHNGAGGQIAWADPATGLSFAFVTNGYDRHEVRQPRRTTSLGSLAAITAPRR